MNYVINICVRARECVYACVCVSVCVLVFVCVCVCVFTHSTHTHIHTGILIEDMGKFVHANCNLFVITILHFFIDLFEFKGFDLTT